MIRSDFVTCGEPACYNVNTTDRNLLSFCSLCEAQKHRCIQKKLTEFMKDCSINGSWTQWLKCKPRLEKLIYSLTLGLNIPREYIVQENIPREILSFSFPCCLCLSTHYLPTLGSGSWTRWTFALFQFQFCVFSSPEESQPCAKNEELSFKTL